MGRIRRQRRHRPYVTALHGSNAVGANNPHHDAVWDDKIGSHTDPVKIVQDALSDAISMSLDAMVGAIDQIVRENLWQGGRPFESFGDFAVALPPAGLGIRSERPMKLLRHALPGGSALRCSTDIDRQQTNWYPASSVAEQMMRWQPLAATKA
jgi:hypothetical protein